MAVVSELRAVTWFLPQVMCVERLRSRRTFLCMVLDRYTRSAWQLPPPDFCVLLCRYLEDTIQFLVGDEDTVQVPSFRVKQGMLRDLDILALSATILSRMPLQDLAVLKKNSPVVTIVKLLYGIVDLSIKVRRGPRNHLHVRTLHSRHVVSLGDAGLPSK